MSLKDRTKYLFADTLKDLMKSKDLKDIRIGELCAACGAHRRTFYYHFQDKYDLMAWILSHGYDDPSMPENIMTEHTQVNVLSRMRDNQTFYRRLYSDPGISELSDYLLRYNVESFEEQLLPALGAEHLSDEQKFSLRMYCYGGIYMSREWILGGCRLEPEELAERMKANMPEWMKAADDH